jgi:hypothetical protein
MCAPTLGTKGIFNTPIEAAIFFLNNLAVLSILESDKEIKPADGLSSETRPSLYKKVRLC